MSLVLIWLASASLELYYISSCGHFFLIECHLSQFLFYYCHIMVQIEIQVHALLTFHCDNQKADNVTCNLLTDAICRHFSALLSMSNEKILDAFRTKTQNKGH